MPKTGTGKTAFVLPGGGSFGAIQVGMLKALVAHGVVPDFVVGASAGALNSAYFAGDPNSEGTKRLEAIWRGIKSGELFPGRLAMAWQFVRHGRIDVDPAPLRRLIESHLPFRLIEEARMPLHILAADFMSGAPVVFSEGPVADAVLASSALPTAFSPVKHGNRYLTDGGCAHHSALTVAADQGATRIYLLPVNVPCGNTQPPVGLIARSVHALNLLSAGHTLSEVLKLGASVEISVVPPLCPLKGSLYEFSQTASLIERAYASTRAWLERGEHESCVLPQAMFAHSHV